MDYYSIHAPVAKEAFSIFLWPLIKGSLRIAFTGTRHEGLSACVAGIVASSLKYTLSDTDYHVSVGDATGVDREVVENLHGSSHTIFRVEGNNPERKDYAIRSVKCLESILPRENAIVLAFPADKCPARVDTKKRFAGRGSGTWGTVGLALAHSIDVLMYVPPNTDYQQWSGPLKKFAELVTSSGQTEGRGDPGSWIRLHLPPQPEQASLF